MWIEQRLSVDFIEWLIEIFDYLDARDPPKIQLAAHFSDVSAHGDSRAHRGGKMP